MSFCYGSGDLLPDTIQGVKRFDVGSRQINILTGLKHPLGSDRGESTQVNHVNVSIDPAVLFAVVQIFVFTFMHCVYMYGCSETLESDKMCLS